MWVDDRAVLEILDRHWFRKTLLSAEPPPVQFEVPEHRVHMRGTFPAARVGAFVTFDAAGRVTALGASDHRFNGPLLPELARLSRLETLHLDGNALTGCLPPAWQDRFRVTTRTNGEPQPLPYCPD
ncbi:MAG: hypothetical protein OXC13_16055 [Caldilineaceae bacterium]|nr:hypothetical protein [Caldilineaceae bacterium]